MYTRYTLGPLEEEIMNFIWSKNPTKGVTVKDVHKHISQTRDIAYTTVFTVMGRLVDKRFLKRIRIGQVYVYKSTEKKNNVMRKLVSKMVDRLLRNFGDEVILEFIAEADRQGLSDTTKEKLLNQLQDCLKTP